MAEHWTLNIRKDNTPDEIKRLGWLVASLQLDAYVERVEIQAETDERIVLEVNFFEGRTHPFGATFRSLNHVFGDGGVHRMSKWELLLADDELSGV